MSEVIARLLEKLRLLRPNQLVRVERLVDTLAEGSVFESNDETDVATANFCEEFGDILRQHHNVSAEPFSKDKFEYATVSVLNDVGRRAKKSAAGNPGHDLTVDGVPWSLKTQADRNIRADTIHISKFMELGKGSWQTEDDLIALRTRMFNHMRAYERIFTLRCLSRGAAPRSGMLHIYELVEIPKTLLLKADGQPVRMKHDSRQNPKPASCYVYDERGRLDFELYFDGGTERKLQIRSLAKRNCIVHATWTFTAAE